MKQLSIKKEFSFPYHMMKINLSLKPMKPHTPDFYLLDGENIYRGRFDASWNNSTITGEDLQLAIDPSKKYTCIKSKYGL